MTISTFDAARAAWRRAFLLNMSAEGSREGNLELVQTRLKVLYMEVNPYSLMGADAVDQLLVLLERHELKNFFLRMTSRFQFSGEFREEKFIELVDRVYEACNVHHEVAVTVSDSDERSVNKLGDENAQVQLTLQEVRMIMVRNRWLLTVCLFILLFDGGVQ